VNPVFSEHFDLERRRDAILVTLRTDVWVMRDAMRQSKRVTVCAGGHELRHSWWLDAALRRLRFMPTELDRLRATIERLRDIQPKYQEAIRALPPIRAARRW